MVKKITKKLLYLISWLNPASHRKVNVFNPDTSYENILNLYPKKDTNVVASNSITHKYDLHIIMPTYNAGKYIQECLDSIFNQRTEFNFLVTVVDDGSTDDTQLKVEKYLCRENFVYIKKKNGGPSSARNLALTNIQGRFISFVDSDDYLDRYFIQKMVKTCIDKEADCVQCNLERFLEVNFKTNNINKISVHKAKTRELMGFAGGFVCKSEFFQNICFPEGYWFEDTLCCFGLFSKMSNIYKINESLYKHRMTASGFTGSASGNLRTLETIYITDIMLKEFPFKKETAELNSEILRTQIICNINRLSTLSFDCQMFAFSIIYSMYVKMASEGLILKNNFFKLITSQKYFLIKKYCRFH